MARRFGAPIRLDDWWAALRWRIVKDTGWTLEYVEKLGFEDIWAYLSVEDGNARADASLARRRNRMQRKPRRRRRR